MINVEVEFRGLCLFVVPPDSGDRRVGVAMPYAHSGQEWPSVTPSPPGGTEGPQNVPHVGYLSCPLADIDGIGLSGAGPSHDFVHRFGHRDTLTFETTPPAPESVPHVINVPNVDRFAPELRLLAGLFSGPPPEDVLMQTVLVGGQLGSESGPFYSDFEHGPPDELPTRPPSGCGTPGCCGGEFAGSVSWTTAIDAEHLVVRIVPFVQHGERAREPMELRLRPSTSDNTVRIRVANQCANNPLDWSELGDCRPVGFRAQDRYDRDFRWHYRLFSRESREALLKRTGGTYPVPRVDRRDVKELRTCPPSCNPARITAQF